MKKVTYQEGRNTAYFALFVVVVYLCAMFFLVEYLLGYRLNRFLIGYLSACIYHATVKYLEK